MIEILNIVIAILLTIPINATEIEPYLVIKTTDNQRPIHSVKVSVGQNISLKCIVYPSDHTVLWQAWGKQKPTEMIATLNLLNIHNSDSGIYTCESPSAELEKKVNVIVEKGSKHDHDSFEFTHDPIDVKDVDHWNDLKLFYSDHENDDYWKYLYLNDWDSVDDNSIEDNDYHYKREKSKVTNIMLWVAGVILVFVVTVLVYVGVRNYISDRKTQATPNTRLQTNPDIPARSFNAAASAPPCHRDAHIPLYRSEGASSTLAPIVDSETNRTTVISMEPQTPPPSYDEVMYNAKPNQFSGQI